MLVLQNFFKIARTIFGVVIFQDFTALFLQNNAFDLQTGRSGQWKAPLASTTLTYSIPVPGQLYDPAPVIPSFLASFGCSCFNYYLYHGRCLASRSHLPF